MRSILPLAALCAGSCVATAPDEAALAAQLAAGRKVCAAGDHSGAIRIFSSVLAIRPGHVDALRWRGHAKNLTGRYSAALTDFDRALELAPRDTWLWYARGMSYHKLGSYEAAVASYSRALEVDPKLHKVRSWRGFTRQLAGEHRAALADFSMVLADRPDDGWARSARARSHSILGNADAAYEDGLLALDLAPEDASLAAQAGFLAVLAGNDTAALAHFEKAFALDGAGQPHARIWAWFLGRRRGAANVDAQLADFFAAYRTREGHEAWPLRIADWLAGKGTAEELVAAAREGGENAAQRVCEAWFYIGLRHQLGERFRQARDAFRSCLATEQRDAWAWRGARLLER